MKNNKKLSILIIDDNPGDQLLLQENLKSTGLNILEVRCADTLADGLLALQHNHFSLAFLDLFLPDSEGLSSLSVLLELNHKLPIIIYSGMADTEIALKAITIGAQDFLIKGDYNIRLLEKTVRYSIERKINLDALEESYARYSLLSKATHDMVWDWDLQTNKIYRNKDGWKKIFKTKDDAVINTQEDWPLKVLPEDRAMLEQLIRGAITSDTDLFEADFRIIRDDGSIGFIEDRGYVLRDSKGIATRIIGASHDITERKSAEQNLKLSEQRFRSLVQNSHDLLAILDDKGSYTYMSSSSWKILGYGPEFFLGKDAFSFIHPDDQAKTIAAFEEVAHAGHAVAQLFRFLNSKGEWRWIESAITNLLDDPAVGGIVVNSRDVTDKKRADDEIQKLSLVAKNTLSGVFILNKDREILWVNEAFTNITGFSFEDAFGKLPSTLFYPKGTDQSVFNELTDQLNKGLIYEGEMLNYTKSGRQIWVRLQLQTIFNADGEVIQYFGVQTDITRQKELEEKVEFEKILKQKQITEAVYGAQENERSEIGRELHDNINQLLGAIRLYVTTAKTDEENRESLLEDASAFTLTAIEEIRKLSKTLITPLIRDIGLVDSIKGIADEIRLVHPLRIQVDAVDFSDCDYDDKFKLNIFRICQEQLNNVLKHAKATEVIITIRIAEQMLLVHIADNGIGFDTTKRRRGVGLTNIKSRSEMYDGKVEITSAEGKGTTLSLVFEKQNLSAKYL